MRRLRQSGTFARLALLALLLLTRAPAPASAQSIANPSANPPANPPAAVEAGSGGGRQLAGALLAVVALGAVGTGAHFSVRVGKLERDIEAVAAFESKVPEEHISSKVQAGKRAQLLQWAGYGTALAAGAAAAVLLIGGPPPARAVEGHTPVTVRPLVAPAAGGAMLAGGSLQLTF